MLFFLATLFHKPLLICLPQSIATNTSTMIYISPNNDSTEFGIWGEKANNHFNLINDTRHMR